MLRRPPRDGGSWPTEGSARGWKSRARLVFEEGAQGGGSEGGRRGEPGLGGGGRPTEVEEGGGGREEGGAASSGSVIVGKTRVFGGPVVYEVRDVKKDIEIEVKCIEGSFWG